MLSVKIRPIASSVPLTTSEREMESVDMSTVRLVLTWTNSLSLVYHVTSLVRLAQLMGPGV